MYIYQFFVKIGLVFTLICNFLFGAIIPAQHKTVEENGSLAAVDELGRQIVSAGKSKKLAAKVEGRERGSTITKAHLKNRRVTRKKKKGRRTMLSVLSYFSLGAGSLISAYGVRLGSGRVDDRSAFSGFNGYDVGVAGRVAAPVAGGRERDRRGARLLAPETGGKCSRRLALKRRK